MNSPYFVLITAGLLAGSGEGSSTKPAPEGQLLFHEPFEHQKQLAELGADMRGGRFVPGFAGRGYVALDDGDGISYPLDGRFPLHEGTLELWVRPNWSGYDPDSHVFVSAGDAFVKSYSLHVAHEGVLRMGVLGSTTKRGPNLIWKAGRWHHLVLAWGDGRQMQLLKHNPTPVRWRVTAYVDGVLVQEESGYDPKHRDGMTVPDTLWIGSRAGTGPADAVIDELRLWRRRLEKQEIRARFTSARAARARKNEARN